MFAVLSANTAAHHTGLTRDTSNDVPCGSDGNARCSGRKRPNVGTSVAEQRGHGLGLRAESREPRVQSLQKAIRCWTIEKVKVLLRLSRFDDLVEIAHAALEHGYDFPEDVFLERLAGHVCF